VLPAPELVTEILAVIPQDRWIGFDELLRACPSHDGVTVGRALVWLSKFGVLRPRAAEKENKPAPP